MGVSSQLLLTLILLLNSTAGMGQVECYSTADFSCSSERPTLRVAGQDCCDEGFLSFNTGADICQLCSGNVICSANIGCTDGFNASQSLSRGECCATGGGVAYTDSAGRCLQCPRSITGCYSEVECNGDIISVSLIESATAQVRECCLSTAGLSYNLLGQCIDCIVYGFLEERLEAVERGQGYMVGIGYIKRPDSVTNLIRGDILVADDGTASVGIDFQISSDRYTVRPGVNQEIIVTYRVDSIAQEPMETAQLQLSITTTPPRGLLARDTLDLIVIDNGSGCKAEVYQNHSWPNTALGSTALSPCPCVEVLDVFAGNVSRQCSGSISEGGMWKDELDLSSCETTLSDISRELCEIALGLSTNKTTQTSNQIANITSRPQNLTASHITLVTAIVEQVAAEAAINQEVRDNYLQTINNIQQADADVIYESQMVMNSSTRILASLETFVVNLNTSTVFRNSTSNRTVLSFETFAITVQDLDPDSFQGQTFAVDLGPVEEAMKNTGVIDQYALMTTNADNRSEIDSLSEDTENSTASLRLSPSLFEKCPTINRTSLWQRLSYSVFLSDVLFLPENRSTNRVGSIVVAARLACLQTNKTVPIRTSFLIRMTDNVNNSRCAVYKTKDQFGAWDTAGCREITSSNGRKDCECRQLGHFGILFDLNPTSLPEKLSIALSTITYIGLSLSVVCLLVFIFTIFVSKKLLADKQNQILINISISLMCLYFTFLIGGFAVGIPPICGFMSALLQYFFLVFFSWMAVEAVWLYLKLVVVTGSQSLTSKFMLKAGLSAWLLPFMIVVVSAGAGYQYYSNPYYCRPTEWPFYFGFILPFVIIYVLNWIVFVAIMVSICKHFRNLQSLRESSVRQQLRNVKENLIIAMCLSIVLGLGWGLGLVSTSSGLVELSFTFQVIFSIFVGSQGVLIFILYGIRNTNFRQLWIKLFSGCRSNTDNFVSSEKGSTNPRDNSSTVGEELSSMSTLSSKQYSLHNEEKK
ncbi:adhesion G-protein coupled receptor G6-like [Halichondria panicea]|uniref:adhesion G-protein coupled receptor G6-like n=1 Tax=Halichondria panicea TaxID=6063 RepID=UPI00312B7F54